MQGKVAVPVVSDRFEDDETDARIVIGEDGVEMILVPAGEFIMGSPENEGYNDEHPQHRVFLDGFYIDRCEVTNSQYKQFMDATGHNAPKYWDDGKYNRLDQPIVGATWSDAAAYARWAGKRLPTEAEWEKAARGTDGRQYPWGNEWDNSKCNANVAGEAQQYTAPVGSFPAGASPYGVMDMAGNVWEWCIDWYGSNYGQSPRRNPKGHDSGGESVLRGGSWCTTDCSYLRCANRNWFSPSFRFDDAGFRCARELAS